MQWLGANWFWVLPAALIFLSSLITALSPYPKAQGFVKGLQVFFDVLSFMQHKDSPGTFQMPLVQRSTPPGSNGAGKPFDLTGGTPPASGGTTLLILISLATCISGCTPAQTQAWRAVGADTKNCLTADIDPVVKAGEDIVLNLINQKKNDYAAIGKELGLKYGISTAWCILQSLASRLGPVVFGSAENNDPRVAIQWLLDHPTAFLPVVDGGTGNEH